MKLTTKEEYDKAQETIQKYREESNLNFIKECKCAICKDKIVKPIRPEHCDPLKQECGMWDDGVIEKINFGYGSRHDSESFYIAICDDCISDLEKKGLAVNLKQIRRKLDI